MSDKPYKAKPGTFPEKKEIDNDRVTREDFIRQWHNEVEEMMLTYLKRKAEIACADLISREALKDAIYERPESEGNARAAQLLEAIIKAPAVDAEPVRHAMWIQTKDVLGNEIDVCSWCKEEAVGYDGHYGDYITVPTDYCPHCGAKMDGDRDE